MSEAFERKETGRIEAFSDGVFAIAITLLVLTIKAPTASDVGPGGLGPALLALWPHYLAFVTSFAIILDMWVNHHRIFTLVRRSDHVFLYWNGLLLLGTASSRSPDPGSLRRLLIRDHERLDKLFVELLDQFIEGDPNDVRAMWARFDAGLSAHLDAEERHLLPLFARAAPGEAVALRQEHAVFRRALDELGVGVGSCATRRWLSPRSRFEARDLAAYGSRWYRMRQGHP
jgi:hypothetical protein